VNGFEDIFEWYTVRKGVLVVYLRSLGSATIKHVHYMFKKSTRQGAGKYGNRIPGLKLKSTHTLGTCNLSARP
jgi:hypothetical protein